MNLENELALAQQKREEDLLDTYIGERLDILLSAKTVGPAARQKLSGLLKYYAKKKHPFRACVKDNMKRFGPGRTEAVCATLKDLMMGTTKWRNNKRFAGSDNFSDNYVITDEVADLLLSISNEDLEDIIMNTPNTHA
jgi:hypothetical protein